MIIAHVPSPKNVGEDTMMSFGFKMPEYACTLFANEYQALAMRTCSIPYEDRQGMLVHATTGLASEAGEDEAPATVEPPKQEPETKPQAPKVDLAEVRKACVAYRDKHGQAALVEVFGKLGAKKLPDVQEEKYAELMELVKV